MNRLLVIAFLTFAAIAISLWLVQRNHQATLDAKTAAANAQNGYTGNEFLVDGNKVQVTLASRDRVKVGESFNIELRFDPPTNPGTSGLGNEHDGEFTPTLSVSDCTVVPNTQRAESSTQLRGLQGDQLEEQLHAFSWTWTVSDCREGDQLIRATLDFDGASDSDREPYRESQYVSVVQPWTFFYLQPIVSALFATIAGAFGVILSGSQVLELLSRRK